MLRVLYITTLCLLTLKVSSAQVQAKSSIRAPNLGAVVKSLAGCISNNLQNSEILATYNQFSVDNPSNLIFRVATNFLTTAGICDPQLAEQNADSANKAGPLTSKLFFDTVGFINANFMASKGLVTMENAGKICLDFINSIELDACANSPTDILTMMNSVTSGSYNVYKQYGLTDYQSMTSVFKLFDIGIRSLSDI